eukprot:UN33751
MPQLEGIDRNPERELKLNASQRCHNFFVPRVILTPANLILHHQLDCRLRVLLRFFVNAQFYALCVITVMSKEDTHFSLTVKHINKLAQKEILLLSQIQTFT